jgi:hypothetical protein
MRVSSQPELRPGCLYSLPAMVMTWLLMSPWATLMKAPRAFCALEGVERDQMPQAAVGRPGRWRSPYRWCEMLLGRPESPGRRWWQQRVSEALVALAGHAGNLEWEDWHRAVLVSHATGGLAM